MPAADRRRKRGPGEVGQKCGRPVTGVFGRPDGRRRWGCLAPSAYRDGATRVARPDIIEITKAGVRGMRNVWEPLLQAAADWREVRLRTGQCVRVGRA